MEVTPQEQIIKMSKYKLPKKLREPKIGTIYVYSYPLYQREYGWYKIGKTIQTAKERVKQQTTGMPEGATLHFQYNIEIEKESEIYALEKSIQDRFKLKDKHVLEGGGTEWFGPTNLDEINAIAKEEIAKLKNKELTKTYIDYSPRKCQIEGTPALEQGLKHYDKVQVAAATGTGKTILCYSIVRNTNKTVLFLCPTISLVKQSFEEWSNFEQLNAMIVCSDNDAGDDETVVSTNPNKIEAFLLNPMNTRLNVVFGTYHSATKIAEAQAALGNHEFDIVFYDEAHQTVTHKNGRNYQAVLDSVIKSKKKVFVTATRKVIEVDNGRLNVANMNDELVYGKLVYELTTKEAIEKGWSCPFVPYMIQVDEQEMTEAISELINNTTISYSSEIMKARHVASLICIIKSINELGSKKIATFHQTNDSAIAFSELILELQNSGHIADDVLIRDLTSKEKIDFRSRFLATEFCNTDTAIITSAKWMREGVDIPCLDTIVLVDPIRSGIAGQQTVGRGLRIDPNNPNKVCNIIIPMIMGSDNTDADDTLLTVLTNMHDLSEGVEFNFNIIQPRTVKPIPNRQGPGDDIPDARLIELREYQDLIKLKAWGIYDRIQREEMIERTEEAFYNFSF